MTSKDPGRGWYKNVIAVETNPRSIFVVGVAVSFSALSRLQFIECFVHSPALQPPQTNWFSASCRERVTV